MKKSIKKRELILEETIHLSYRDGFENISTKKISDELSISEGSIFYHFDTKATLLIQCLYYIDRQIDQNLKEAKIDMLHPSHTIRDLWYHYFQFLLDHPTYTRYYRDFRFSRYYTEDVIKGQDTSFSFFSKLANGYLKIKGVNLDMFWIYLIETTLNFANRMNQNHISKTPENIDKIYNIIINGVSGALSK